MATEKEIQLKQIVEDFKNSKASKASAGAKLASLSITKDEVQEILDKGVSSGWVSQKQEDALLDLYDKIF